jgi:pimeloyl-ACP methyl ester carboxylesterase
VVDRRPDLFERLVVLNMPHPRLLLEAFYGNLRQLARSWYIFFFQLPWLPEKLIARRNHAFIKRAFLGMTTRRDRFPPEVLDAYVLNAARPGALTAMVNYYRAAMSIRNFRRSWRRLEVPVQIIWGMKDLALGAELLQGTARFAPKAKIHRIAKASHWVQQDAVEEVNQVIREFLAE